jgi:PAT family beta-lactamase induction signal transducer AmpG
VAVGTSTRSRLVLFTGLYFAQGVPWGFFTVAIMLKLSGLGLGPAALGQISSTAWLPWILKPLFGPLVDRIGFGRLGRRRPFILIAEIGMAVSLLAMAMVDPTHDLARFSTLLFVHNLFAAGQDVGTDALAIDLLPENERGRANGFMSAGKFAGVVAGGQGLLLIARVAGWSVAYAMAVALLLIPATLVLSVRETTNQRERRRIGRDILQLLSFRTVFVAAFLAAIIDGSDSFLFPLVYPLLGQRLHFSDMQISTLATLGGGVSAIASVLGGWMSDRLGRRRTLLFGCLGIAGFDVAFALLTPYWGNYTFQLTFTAASAIASGIVYAATLALFMDLTHPRLAATHFQVSMALLNVRGIWGNRIGGYLAERLPATTMFGIAALVELVPLALLLAVDPGKAKAAFAQPVPSPSTTRDG